jgi:catechol 2,3-dioxygenase-like lactoylglutathione lyase family enzyme
MKLERIDHVQLAMPAGKEGKARKFYSGLLGIPEVPKPQILAARGGVWFENNNIRVHLGVDPNFIPAKKAHPAFQVSDLRALIKCLRNAEVEMVEDDLLAGYFRVYVDDPFGNRLELMEPHS